MKQSLLVGITGGIGSGKSTVSSVFSILGVPVYQADQQAKKLMTADKSLKDAIVKTFGATAYHASGELNKDYLVSKIFDDSTNRQKMNHLVHPVVDSDFKKWVKSHKGHPYLIKEAALLLEPTVPRNLDRYIVVTSPKSTRLNRVLKRDPHRTTQDILNIMSHQQSEKDLVRQADYVIVNDETKLVVPQILDLHIQFMLESDHAENS